MNGVFKLWDVRKFECVQTWSGNISGTGEKDDNSRLCCFEYCKLKPRDVHQKEDDSRIYCASKQVRLSLSPSLSLSLSLSLSVCVCVCVCVCMSPSLSHTPLTPRKNI